MSSPEHYVSASQVSVYIGNMWLDDANHIEFNQMSSKVPYYGYNDTHYRTIGQGKVIVTGALMINFRFTNYLTKAIMMARRGIDILGLKEATSITAMVKAIQKSEMLGAKDFVSADDFGGLLMDIVCDEGKPPKQNLYAAASKYSEYSRVSRYLKDRFWNDGKSKALDELLEDYRVVEKASKNAYPAVTDPRVRKRVDIIVNYSPTDGMVNPELVKVLEDVHFTGEGSRIDNSRAEFGGSPVVERYEFMAKRVSPLSLRGK